MDGEAGGRSLLGQDGQHPGGESEEDSRTHDSAILHLVHQVAYSFAGIADVYFAAVFLADAPRRLRQKTVLLRTPGVPPSTSVLRQPAVSHSFTGMPPMEAVSLTRSRVVPGVLQQYLD